MGIEIERKFLLGSDDWRAQAIRSEYFCQGYLTEKGPASVRVRVSGNDARLNIKAAVIGSARAEYEYPIPLAEAREMLEKLCLRPVIEKTRYWVPVGPHTWEIDVFAAENAGLVVAEIELSHPDERFEHPAWLGREVTEEHRYYNNQLARRPYAQWQAHERN